MFELKQEITLKTTDGLHAALAAKVVQLAGQFDAYIQVEYEDKVMDAKSLLGLLSLAIPYGENLHIIADGVDAEEAIREIQKLLS